MPQEVEDPTENGSKPVVPIFLQKLYEIVNDPQNEGLIQWSERGDSFYVLDQDRFSREVLGHWFKHQKFASFVRQLNMYGFRKVQNLQQHVLKSDVDPDHCHFENPNFIRDQPKLLCNIQRKKSTSPP
ncbi:winged helix DNA-binding domain-containing protein, partial [Neolentinus lepideus HHB14362 ss-1]